MQQLNLFPAEALGKIKSVRPQVRPLLAYLDQLQVFHACGSNPLDQPVYLHWKLGFRCQTGIRLPGYAKPSSTPLLQGGKVLQERAKVLAKVPFPIPYASATGAPGILLRCKHCGMSLASGALLLRSTDTGDYCLAKPVEWMKAEMDNREHKGELQCPGCDCEE